MFRQRDARERVRNHGFHLILRDVAVDMPVDRHRRRFIATAEAGHALHLHFRIRRFPALCIESGAKLGGAAKMAGHILANAHVHFWRRREMKMRIKTCNAVQPVERKINFRGKILQLVGGQVAELR